MRAFCDLLLIKYLGMEMQNVSDRINKAIHHLMEIGQLKNVHVKVMMMRSPSNITLGGIIHWIILSQ